MIKKILFLFLTIFILSFLTIILFYIFTPYTNLLDVFKLINIIVLIFVWTLQNFKKLKQVFIKIENLMPIKTKF